MNEQDHALVQLASLSAGALGLGAGLTAHWLGGSPTTAVLVGLTAGSFALGGVVAVGLGDRLATTWTAGRATRERLRAARAVYQHWAAQPVSVPATLREVPDGSGRVRPAMRWLEDHEPNTRAWRACMLKTLQEAHRAWRESGGKTTGLTQDALVGEGKLFASVRAYRKVIKALEGLQLVGPVVNGQPTRLCAEWSYPKAEEYLRTSAVLPEYAAPPPEWRR